MTAKELRGYMGKRVRFQSNRTRRWVGPDSIGEISEVKGREVYCAGDWHESKTFVVIEVLPPKEETP